MLIVKGRGVHLHVEGESLVYIGTFFGDDGAAWARKFVDLFNAYEERKAAKTVEVRDATTVKVPKETWQGIVQALTAALESPEHRKVYQVGPKTVNLLWCALKRAREAKV